jgi:hypothetical protein
MDSVALGIGFILVLSGALISVGARTSTAAVVGCLGAVVALIHNNSMPGVSETKPDMWIWLSVLAILACSLALLGPGGYSLDARLFGWKTVHLSSRHHRIEIGTHSDFSQSREAHENDGNS